MKAVEPFKNVELCKKKVYLTVFSQTYDMSKPIYFIFSSGAAKAAPGESLGTLV